MPFTLYKQHDHNDCGPTCLRMVAKYYGRKLNIQTFRRLCDINREGVSLFGLSEGARTVGFEAEGVKLTSEELKAVKLPCILHWHENHFVVLYKIKADKFYLADPAAGKIPLKQNEFNRNWAGAQSSDGGIALLLNTTRRFYEFEDEQGTEVNWRYVFKYFFTYRKLLGQLLLSLLIGTLLQLILPFLTQSIVDVGIHTRNLSFIAIVLIAQLALIIGRVSIDFLRSWLLLHISTRVNISVITDFLIKLMRLPLSFFDAKNTGDIMQRINDQLVIQSFLTGPTLSSVFSLVNLIVFSCVLVWYNTAIFLVFMASSALYVGWILFFLKFRRTLNYKNFEVSSANQSNIIQLVNGMQEIKLNNSERQKRWEWENLQVSLFNISTKNLALSQYQQGGSTLINEGANLVITFLSARAVIEGRLTLGAMVAVQYIIGQLNSPVQQFLGFIQGYQDAKISMERLNEIHQLPDEEPADREWKQTLPEDKSISIHDLTFAYQGNINEPVLQNITMHIPQGKTTALVGMSGSGKTTLIKLLLRFYKPQTGKILVGGQPLHHIAYKPWRGSCGVVMQDGFIFSDTIERNIAVGEDVIDKEKLNHAIETANIQ
ncbi:MAG: Toxin translocation ATP-binding protein, partial [Mucilaginibacter sp.]|nr:Toxin translocation ATP-binding protein [Mucilaginibacter sp.]